MSMFVVRHKPSGRFWPNWLTYPEIYSILYYMTDEEAYHQFGRVLQYSQPKMEGFLKSFCIDLASPHLKLYRAEKSAKNVLGRINAEYKKWIKSYPDCPTFKDFTPDSFEVVEVELKVK